MKKLLTIILALALSLCACFSLVACGDKEEKIVDVTTKTVTVGYTVYDPMNYTDDNGIFTGFDTELAIRVFNALGYDVMFKEIDWDNKYLELNSNTIDCVWNGFTMNSTDKNSDGVDVSRSELCDFSLEYMMNGQCLFARQQNNITDLKDLAGKTLSYEVESAAASLINSEDSDFAGINYIDSALAYQKDAAEQVMNGNKDYAVIDIILAQKLISSNASYKDCVICDIDLGAEVYAIGFKKGSELAAKVNTMLKAYAEIGYLEELATKYDLKDNLISSWDK